MSTTFALVGPGAMGAGLSARLVARGAQVLTTLEGRSDASRARAQAAGMTDVAPAALMQAPVFLSVVPPAEALAMARQFASWCVGVDQPPRYVDLNAVNPDTVHEVQAVIEAAGATFVDGCIVGFPPKGDEIGPTLYVSRDAADLAEALNAHGVVTQLLDGGVGAASALKMAYAGLSKGVAALGVAMVLAAERHGAGEALRAALAETRPGLLALLDRGLPDLLPKAWRWAPEMEQIADFIGHHRPEAAIYTAMASQYRAVAQDLAGSGEEAAVLRAFPQLGDD
ncbi:NAD binding domain of 6-phosphogluconate dehydrogenase [Pseudoxanthomonas sp. GM95]|uniref:NAD(P)-dependent oxidoreductase n=1 Tax=Pseudoxanthomonas sp. GM95 TaxID=1881043 RepID=UPI0008C738AC|nr:NAD(P)-dependent oxidoreductase [Pseudoxanthomonas sp. GM95]SEM40731.1 NAD binding domain of 6-phosphogluconate dehydrogenase [Pseudoxanthomonas sp. GM95]